MNPLPDRDAIASLWQAHCSALWPRLPGSHEGELMTLDTVISGCVVYFLDSPEGLDAQRISILQDCLADLERLSGELEEEGQDYFIRLHHLGSLLVQSFRPR